jgi:hypothetical protein
VWAKQLVVGGYLREEPSLALVAEMLDILEDAGHGLRRPTLQPCALEFFWDDEAGRVQENIDLSFAIDWIDASHLREAEMVPEEFTHAKSPLCTDLIYAPEEALRDPKRRPGHVCGEEFLRQSTELWAQAQLADVDSVHAYRWASMYPLPIGRLALEMNPDVTDPSEWAEVFGVLPFEGSEKAAWAVHVEQGGDETWSTLDLFGLEEMQDMGFPVAGPLAHRSFGTDTSLVDVLTAAETWWGKFRGISLPHRPKGTGTWDNLEDFCAAYRQAKSQLVASKEKPTIWRIAKELNVSGSTVKRWLKDCRNRQIIP